MIFTVRRKEILIHEDRIEASSQNEALELFRQKIANGEFDFSDGCLVDSEDYIVTESATRI